MIRRRAVRSSRSRPACACARSRTGAHTASCPAAERARAPGGLRVRRRAAPGPMSRSCAGCARSRAAPSSPPAGLQPTRGTGSPPERRDGRPRASAPRDPPPRLPPTSAGTTGSPGRAVDAHDPGLSATTAAFSSARTRVAHPQPVPLADHPGGRPTPTPRSWSLPAASTSRGLRPARPRVCGRRPPPPRLARAHLRQGRARPAAGGRSTRSGRRRIALLGRSERLVERDGGSVDLRAHLALGRASDGAARGDSHRPCDRELRLPDGPA